MDISVQSGRITAATTSAARQPKSDQQHRDNTRAIMPKRRFLPTLSRRSTGIARLIETGLDAGLRHLARSAR